MDDKTGWRTEQLHDAGEEKWPIKLHVGCGGVYLNGYTNIDAQGHLASELLDLKAGWDRTTVSSYYLTKASWGSLPGRKEVVVDKRIELQDLGYEYARSTVDKILAVQVLEHLDPIDFVATLDAFQTMLRKPGVLIVSVPDMIGTMGWLSDPEKTEFAIRHLRGTMKDEWSQHKSWWTEESLVKAMRWIGLDRVRTLPNFHCYPAVVVKGRKIGR